MKRLLALTLSILLCTITMSAQTFTEHITSNNAGEGTVIVHQDSILDDMVNGKKQYVPEKKEGKREIPGVIPKGKRTKARGYRIQVYWGGSTSADQTKAQRAGTRVTAIFPELRAYTTYESPHWRCRVGDFGTYKEATEYLGKIRTTSLSQDAIIVKSEVFIYQ
ncbi:MAG: SPOR domain-containing protein [Bacteroidaceae bacterium]|nr:SPOR domain-containing protein [Bacteroidaceae bacterium]